MTKVSNSQYCQFSVVRLRRTQTRSRQQRLQFQRSEQEKIVELYYLVYA